MAQITTSPQHLTKTEVAAQWLRERIRLGELAPGQRLRVDELARDLGMSPTPVREALRLLQTDRLVDYRSHVGHVVASPAALGEIMRLRVLLESLATELAVPVLQRSPTLSDELEALHERYRVVVERGRGTAIAEQNALWHVAIYAAADWVHLPKMIHGLWELFPWRTMWAVPGHSRRSFEDHDRIMQAIRAGDPALAAQGMSEHIARGSEVLLAPFKASLRPTGPETVVGD